MPAGTPPEIVKRLPDEVGKAMALREVRQRVLPTGAAAVGDAPEAFAAFQAREHARLADAIAKTGIVPKDRVAPATAPIPHGGYRSLPSVVRCPGGVAAPRS